MTNNLSGDSPIIKTNNYAIEENSCYKNYIVPNSTSITGTVFLIPTYLCEQRCGKLSCDQQQFKHFNFTIKR